jgi:hypothetical protein
MFIENRGRHMSVSLQLILLAFFTSPYPVFTYYPAFPSSLPLPSMSFNYSSFPRPPAASFPYSIHFFLSPSPLPASFARLLYSIPLLVFFPFSCLLPGYPFLLPFLLYFTFFPASSPFLAPLPSFYFRTASPLHTSLPLLLFPLSPSLQHPFSFTNSRLPRLLLLSFPPSL